MSTSAPPVAARSATPPAVATRPGRTAAAPNPQAGKRFSVLRRRHSDESAPRWARPGLVALLVATAALYLINLTNSGYANEFYAAAVKSATKSWTAWLWASLDANLSITVDKPPAAIWIMGLSARLFGFSSASMLIPQALMGVATVALVYGAVRRLAGYGAGLFAGALVALTPVAALMFRFNNPDALLTLCMTAAAYAVVRAVQTQANRRAAEWLAVAGWLIGVAFLTKMLQGLLVLPALAAVYLICAGAPWWKRLVNLLGAATALIVSAGWLIALCAVWPASARPYIGGSSNNSLWELALGYNGLGRILGGAGNGGGGAGGGNTGFGGAAGLLRMFNAAFGTEVSWFLPAAALLLVAGLVFRGTAPRTDPLRASLVLWGGWLVVTAAVFSFMSGTIHPYYAVALVPGIAGTVASGAAACWRRFGPGPVGLAARAVVAVAVAVTGVWSYVLLAVYAGTWLPWLKFVALGAGVGGALIFFLAGVFASSGWAKRMAVAALLVATIGAVAPSAAWTFATAAQGHNGSIPTSGPKAAGMGGTGQGGAPVAHGTNGGASGQPPSGASGTQPGGGTQTSGGGQARPGGTGSGTNTSGPGTRATQPSGMGGETTSSALVTLLNKAGTSWSAAVVGDQSAAGLILNTNTSVYCIGGWSGTDDNVSLAQFKALVASGKIHYFIVGGQGGGMGGRSGSASQITAWVTSTFSSTTVGGQTVYDLTKTK